MNDVLYLEHNADVRLLEIATVCLSKMSSPMEMPTEPLIPSSAGPPLGEDLSKAHELSAEELKALLFRSLQTKGVLAQLKSQLRCRLVQELKCSGSGTTMSSIPLGLQVANSIIAEHLRVCGYEYSLSTFLPESHTNLDNLLSRDDIVHYLHLSPSSPLYTALNTDSSRGFLRDLLEAFTSVPVGVATCDHTHSIGTQTEKEGGRDRAPATLEERLRSLDEHHMTQLEKEVVVKGDWKIEYENQLKKEMNREMEEFKERELSKIKEEERLHYEMKLHNLQIEQEEKYRKKMESIRRLELDTIDRLRRKEMETEATLFARRQEIEAHLQTLGKREDQLRQDTLTTQHTISLTEQRLTVAMEQLATREKEIIQYKQHIEAVVNREREECETRMRIEQGKQVAIQTELERLKTVVKKERQRKEEMETVLHETSKQLVELQRQREDTHQAMEKVSDYGVLKQQLTELRTQLTKTERKLSENRAEHRRMQAEQQEIIKGLRKQLGRPNSDQSRILEELERTRRECQLKLAETEEEKRELRRDLVRMSSVCVQQRGQLEDQTLSLREMEREVTDLTTQLSHWQATFIPTSSTRHNHRSGRHYQSHLTPSPSTPSPPTPSPHHYHRPNTTHYHHHHSSDNILSETRSTFVRLEQEALELEKYYQTFHQKINLSTTTGTHLLPTTTTTTVLPSATSTTTPHLPTYTTTFTTTPVLSTTTTTAASPFLPTYYTTTSAVLSTTTATATATATTTATTATSTMSVQTIPRESKPQFSLDQLWKNTSVQPATTTSLHTTVAVSSTPSVPISSNTPNTTVSPLAHDTIDTVHHTPPTSSSSSPTLHSSHDNDSSNTSAIPTTEDGGAVIDPLMMKYMELVRQKREGDGDKIQMDQSEHSQENGSISQITNSFGVNSEPEQVSNPFQDW